MSVTGTSVSTTSLLTVDGIRRFLRDYADKNILLGDVEFTDDDLSAAKLWALLDLNSLPPPLTWDTVESLPSEAQILVLYAIAKHLMFSEAARQRRNQLTAQDGDVAPIGMDDKSAMYENAAQYYAVLFESRAKQWKIAYNMNQAYGSLSSGYINVANGVGSV